MSSSSSTRNQQLLQDLRSSSTPIHEQAPSGSDPTFDCTEQEQGIEQDPSKIEVCPQPVSSPSGSATQTDDNLETVITGILATDVDLGLRRIPVGFYAVLNHSGLEWMTENVRLSVNDHIVEWDGPIPLPSDLSATVCLGIHASFELQPMLGDGEQLRKVTITMSQLLDHSAGDLPFTFLQEDGNGTTPCSSISVNVGRRKREKSDSPPYKVHCSTAGPRGQLEAATNLGHSAFLHYREHGDKLDLERSIEQFQRAFDICPRDHPGRAAAESNMASAKLMHCLRNDSDISLDVPLTLYRNALAARPVGHLDRPFTLIQLAAVHFARIERRWDEVESALAEESLHEAIDLSSAESHETQAATLMLRLHAGRTVGIVQAKPRSFIEQDSTAGLTEMDPWSLSVQLLRRFQQVGELADLQRAISVLAEFLLSIPLYDEKYVAGLANLGLALLHRFSQLGNLDDLEQAISRLELAVERTDDGDPNESAYLLNLSKCFYVRFKRLGERSDIEQAISRQEAAVRLTPGGHPDKPDCLRGLGNCFLIRFQRVGELSDLEQAISSYKDVVDLTPDGHPDKPGDVYNLGSSLRARFEYLSDLEDLEQAISMQSNAANLFPDGHPSKPICLDNLGNSLILRFAHLGEPSDLEQAISRHRAVVDLTPDEPACLNNLGNSLLTRFEYYGELRDLEEAISSFQEADRLTPDGHPNKPRRLNNLGDSLLIRFERLGELDDLGQAILKQRDAVNLTPDDHADKRTYLNNLGNSLTTRFERLGELHDLEQAISRYRDAVQVTRDSHTAKPACLNNLASALVTRFERLGELRDLDQAISRLKDAVKLIPDDGHSDKPSCVGNLGNFLLIRFEHRGELSDLEEAISNSEEVVKLARDGHPNKPIHLSNLGNCLRARFERSGEKGDLEQAISRHEEAVRITPDDHPDRPIRLNNLGKSLLARFKCLGGLTDIEQAISRQKDAVHLTPDGHPNKPGFLSNLGDTLRARFDRLGEPSDLEQAMSLYSYAACSSTGSIAGRFGASQQWISCAHTLQHHSLLDAYSTAVTLLPQLAWIGLSLAHRYRDLIQGADVVREAAAAALDKGYLETAVEWLEQGRSIVWGELFQLRSSYEELSSAHPDHARRLRGLSVALEHASTTREKSLSLSSEEIEDAEPVATESLERQADRHRALAIERDEVLQEIRRLPGFERFLLDKQFTQLRSSAHSGPVVILNASESRCDALIVLADMDNVLHVPLPNFTLRRSSGLRNAVKSLLGPARVARDVERDGEPVKRGHISWESLLSTLWNGVVKPVLDSLAFSQTPGNLSRIFWCPTGPFTFLPIHAAGIYGTGPSEPRHKVSDFVVSSYTPTLSTLVPFHPRDATSIGDLHFLAVPQPQSDGQPQLRGVGIELQHIRAVVQNSASARTTLVEPAVGSVEEVLELMKEADWVHFACHGIQDADNPTESGLCLAGRRRLKLSDIIALSRPRGGLAFLSACQTATGDKALSDEAIHIAAGMLFAGYGGVVGTMWSISDRLAPVVARDVYEKLFHPGPVVRSRIIGRLRGRCKMLSDSFEKAARRS